MTRFTRFVPVWRALVVAGALGLVVAALPALPTSTAGGASNLPAPPGARVGPPPGRADGPGERLARPPDLIGRPVPRVGAAPNGATEEALELLSVLALAGGATGLLLATPGERPAAPLEEDLGRLREELDRLRREQQHLQRSVEWQERLLAKAGGAESAPGEPPSSLPPSA